MADIIPAAYRDTPLDSLIILHEMAEALAAVFLSDDAELLESEGVRCGFGRMARALAESLSDFRSDMEMHLRSTTPLIAERDTARREAAELLAKLQRMEALAPSPENERRQRAPDLSEPAASDASGTMRGGMAS